MDNNKLWIYAITLLVLIGTASATLTGYWITPDQDGAYIAEYPQTLRWYINSNVTITSCTITVDSLTYTKAMGLTSIDLTKEVTLSEGSHAIGISCTNIEGETLTDTKTANIDNMITFQASEHTSSENIIMLAIGVILAVAYFVTKDKLMRKLIALGMMMGSIIALSITKNPVIYIPLAISVIMVLSEIAGRR